METHISWVLLAGTYAYKIKKPVDFGFLDFSTLELRHKYCLEELRLNRRFAPSLYIGVVTITGEPEHPSFDGEGEVLEYAVMMKQFDEDCLAERLIGENNLRPEHVDGLAGDIAKFHAEAAQSSDRDRHGLPATIMAAAEHNFDHLLRIKLHPDLVPEEEWESLRLEAVLSWTRGEFERLREVFLARKNAGFVRECHGDLHCGNLVLIGERLIPFDCIEFSEDLRWIDCLSELAFVLMDIEVHGRPDLAWRLLNRYLEISGDYAGLVVLNFYRVYRAMVRAKIYALSLEQTTGTGERLRLEAQCQRYLGYVERAMMAKTPVLLITHGFSGSGKSYFASRLAEYLPAIRIASDIERKRLAGFAAHDCTSSGLSGGIYTESISRQTYSLLLSLAERLLRSGINVILDATYLNANYRHACRKLANRLGVRFFILDFQAPEAVLRERIAHRSVRGGDPSEAGQAVLTQQIAAADLLESQERPFILTLSSEEQPDLNVVLRAIGQSWLA